MTPGFAKDDEVYRVGLARTIAHFTFSGSIPLSISAQILLMKIVR